MDDKTTRPAIVYLIQCHSNVRQVYGLFRNLYNKNDYFVFMADAKADANLQELIVELVAKFDNAFSVAQELISWGGFSQVKSTVSGITFALKFHSNWTHIINLSGQHTPLYNADQIAIRLQAKTSYLSATKVDLTDTAGSGDLRHRFEMNYKEVPGVGYFGVHHRPIDDLLKRVLFHGSNWIALSRDMCKSLIDSPGVSRILEYFSTSLMPDETSLQTLIFGAGFGSHLPVENRTLTFVARSPGMVFSEQEFFAAQEQGYLFIRKCPNQLTPMVENYLERLVSPDFTDSRAICEFPTVAGDEDSLVQEAFENLRDQIICHADNLDVRQLRPNQVLCPRLYMQVRQADMSRHLFVGVLSENLVDFKVTLIWFDPFTGDFNAKFLGDYVASIIKVRVHDIANNREIHVAEDPSRGFFCINDRKDLGVISKTVLNYLDVAKRITQFIPE